MSRLHPASALALSVGLLAPPLTWAVDWSASGFGTLGYAISDQPYHYQRFINEQGTFKRDTILGGQLDVALNNEWSATVQATVAPSLQNDQGWDLTASWAFLSWRPGNDWLVRAGKQRIPMFLNAENRDVGQTYDLVRLPTEMYAMSPTNDFTGLYVSHSWQPELGELTLDVLGGSADITVRSYARGVGASFMDVRTGISGALLTLRMDESTWRLGVYHAETSRRDGQDMVTSFPYVNLGYGMGYYQVSSQLTGPGVGTSRNIANDVITVGADLALAPNWRLLAEAARNIQKKTSLGANTAGGYVAVLHQMDRLTPYVSFAHLRTLGSTMKIANQLQATSVPSVVPYADQINASQQAAADSIPVYDQSSLAVGASYALTPNSKLKAEWMNTRIGQRSSMLDAPEGSATVSHQRINVLSLNYSFVF
jgi:opacity protein-like surface antigen